MSSWFRDYVYIPLGGNRTGNVYLNLFIVFLLTGIWHGASWNFVLWGIYFGIIIVLEKLISSKSGKNKILPSGIGWSKTMFLWVMSMVLFRADTLADSMAYYWQSFAVCKFGFVRRNGYRKVRLINRNRADGCEFYIVILFGILFA